MAVGTKAKAKVNIIFINVMFVSVFVDYCHQMPPARLLERVNISI